MSAYPRLDDNQIPAALNLWRSGMNTYQIAIDLCRSKKYEPAVANSLAVEREKRREEKSGQENDR